MLVKGVTGQKFAEGGFLVWNLSPQSWYRRLHVIRRTLITHAMLPAWCQLRTFCQVSSTMLMTIYIPFWTIVHYADVMTKMASQITSLTVVYSTVYSDADQIKHQSSASLAFVWGIHRDRWIPRTKGQLREKCFHLMTSSCRWRTKRKRSPRGHVRMSSQLGAKSAVPSGAVVGGYLADNYDDVIMGAMASQITSLTIVYSTFFSGADQRKHQSSASLAFGRGSHQGPVNSPHKWPVTRKILPFDDVINMELALDCMSSGE